MRRWLALFAFIAAQDALALAWYPLSGHTTVAPAVASNGSDFVFVIVDDHQRVMYKFVRASGEQSDYQEVPGSKLTGSSPAALYDDAGVLRIFVRGADNMIYENVGLSAVWTRISNFRISDGIAATSYNGTIYLFARGRDGTIWGKGYADGTWMQMSGPVHGAPAAAAGPAGIELAITGADYGWNAPGPVYHRTIRSVTDPAPWIFLGDRSNSGPGVVVDALGAVRVFTRNLENRISQSINNGPLIPMRSSGATSVPLAANMTIDGKLRLFDIALDGSPWYQNISAGKLRGVVIKVGVSAPSVQGLAGLDSMMTDLGVNAFRLDYLFDGFNAVDLNNPNLAVLDDWVRQQADKGREPL